MQHAANFFSSFLASLLRFSKNTGFSQNRSKQDDPLAPKEFSRGESHVCGTV
jgi:hypothetical protein